ncbi:COBRA-like protein [Arachis hypogaea]|nr:COBRA-like protein [Arachis hypogaea]
MEFDNGDKRRRSCEFRELKVVILAAICFMILSQADAFDPLDPTGNVTIRWDIMSWTTDGYMATVTVFNFQQYRTIMNPGWTIGWTWAKKEIIWTVMGAQATEQGDCSKFKLKIPHSCKRNPQVVDLMPGAPFNMQFNNCCKGGVLTSWGQDPSGAVSAFQIGVGLSGTSNKTVKLPKNFKLLGPGPGYSCGPAKLVPATVIPTDDRRRKAQALILASKNPSCCVSLSSFYSDKVTACPTCACGCQNNDTCVTKDSKLLQEDERVKTKKSDMTPKPLLQCTHHLCHVRVHWHIKDNYQDYWRVKIAIINFDYRLNYTLWNLVIQHPNLNNVTQVYSFEYMPLLPYEAINDTGMFYGLKYYNDLLMENGPKGNVQSEILMKKDKNTFTLKHGWAFPRRVYFNGEECMLPPPDSYPFLPNSAHRLLISASSIVASTIFASFFHLVMILL